MTKAADRVLRVFFDWGCPWPLRKTGTAKIAMEPTDYGYAPELTDLTRLWHHGISRTPTASGLDSVTSLATPEPFGNSRPAQL